MTVIIKKLIIIAKLLEFTTCYSLEINEREPVLLYLVLEAYLLHN